MFVFTIFFGTPSQQHSECISSIHAIYPELIIVDSWGDCPYPQPEDPVEASDLLRIWILSRYDEALYIDADVMLSGKLNLSGTLLFADIPEFSCISYFMIYHNGRKDFFTSMLDYYNNTNKQKFWPSAFINNHISEIGVFKKENYRHLYLSTYEMMKNLPLENVADSEMRQMIRDSCVNYLDQIIKRP